MLEMSLTSCYYLQKDFQLKLKVEFKCCNNGESFILHNFFFRITFSVRAFLQLNPVAEGIELDVKVTKVL